VGIDLKNPGSGESKNPGTDLPVHAAQKARLGTGGSVPAVFLDRDGVVNRFKMRDGTPRPPGGLDELEVYPDAAEALRRLKQAGYLLIVVTNQPDIARGTQTRQVVDQINAALGEALPIDEFVVCAHDNGDNCLCRKPKPGMVLEAAARHAVDLRQSFLIGDRWRDIDCGAAAGVRTVFIERGHGERAPEHAPDFVAGSLGDAAEWILEGGGSLL
jgi:D-glycero-D-manno-heptose 1,7-bisphosphate phosphatase